jgi:hypothetical protein
VQGAPRTALGLAAAFTLNCAFAAALLLARGIGPLDNPPPVKILSSGTLLFGAALLGSVVLSLASRLLLKRRLPFTVLMVALSILMGCVLLAGYITG